MNNGIITGGCQCGKHRYRISGPLFGAHICHCRMCQKAFGNLFAALVGVMKADIAWLGDPPTVFRSSSVVSRGFCVACGTPLTFAYDSSAHMNVSIGSLDQPALARPQVQYGIESRLPCFEELHTLPGSRTEDDVPPDDLARLKSLQHPDRDQP